jgi:CubicO group peptidase (beta-lactamase class C family)
MADGRWSFIKARRQISDSVARLRFVAACIGAVVLGLVLASVIALPAMSANCENPTDLHDGWTVAPPEKEGLDPALICGIGPRLEALKEAKAHGVVVARHGRLIYEHYFAGKDQRLGMPLGDVNFDAGTKHDIRSISKCVTSLLIGIALDRGLLTDLDAPVFSFFPEYGDLRTPEKDRITLRHLLTMSSGLAWDETSAWGSPSNTYWRMGSAPRADHFVLEQPLAASPGTVFNYNTGSVDLLGVILRKVSGKRLDEFAKETLFDPLGIEDWEWEGSSGFNPAAASGLRLRPRDLARIGQLVLERGKWHGRQIVSSSWIEDSTTPRLSGKGQMFDRPEGITSYGYLWWLGRSPPEYPERDMILGAGNGGQRVIILPSLGGVVVTTAGVYAGEASGLTALTTLNEFVFPAAVER